MSDWACIHFGLTVVPLYDTLGVENLSYCLNQSQLTTLFVTSATLKTLLTLKDFGNLKRIISFDLLDNESVHKARQLNLEVLDYQQILKVGSQINNNFGAIKQNYDDIFTFSYTSGTTGPPKGVLMSHGNFLASLSAMKNNTDLNFDTNDRHLSYLPLPHVMERLVSLYLFFGGAYVM